MFKITIETSDIAIASVLINALQTTPASPEAPGKIVTSINEPVA